MNRRTKSKTIQTTLRLPPELRDQMSSYVDDETHGFKSLNDLMVVALKSCLKALRRARVDASFAGMANDLDFQRETEKIMKEFEYADAEAFRLMASQRKV